MRCAKTICVYKEKQNEDGDAHKNFNINHMFRQELFQTPSSQPSIPTQTPPARDASKQYEDTPESEEKDPTFPYNNPERQGDSPILQTTFSTDEEDEIPLVNLRSQSLKEDLACTAPEIIKKQKKVKGKKRQKNPPSLPPTAKKMKFMDKEMKERYAALTSQKLFENADRTLERKMQKLREELATSSKTAVEKSCSHHETELFLPPEIIFEILSRLPVKSLLVFKCVCKLWCSIVEDRKFIDVHMRRAKTIYVYKEKQNEDEDAKEFKCLAVKDGLLVEKHRRTNKYSIRNPATKNKLDLPDPHHKLRVTRLIYLPSTDNYKLVNVYGKKGSRLGGCEVLTVGTDLTWRTLDNPSFYNLNRRRMERLFSVCIGDVFYFMRFSDAGMFAHEIVCLEMKSEHFENVKVPEAFFSSWENVVPFSWEKKLSLSKVVEQELHVWVLEDYKKQKWAERKIVISLSFLSNYPNITEKPIPHKFRKGRLLFRSHKDHKIAYYIESEKVRIKYAPPGENIAYTIQHTLVNPSGVRPSRTARIQGSRFAFGWVTPVSFTVFVLGLNIYLLNCQ